MSQRYHGTLACSLQACENRTLILFFYVHHHLLWWSTQCLRQQIHMTPVHATVCVLLALSHLLIHFLYLLFSPSCRNRMHNFFEGTVQNVRFSYSQAWGCLHWCQYSCSAAMSCTRVPVFEAGCNCERQKTHVASHSNISFGPSPCFLHTRPLCVACK